MLLFAAGLTIAIGLIHSILGEKYLLSRLFQKPLPRLFGNEQFTKQTLRFAWHITSVAWAGLAALMVLLHFGASSSAVFLNVIASTFAFTALVALIASRGKHLSWLVFTSIAALCFVAAAAR